MPESSTPPDQSPPGRPTAPAKYQMLVSAIPKYHPHESEPDEDLYIFSYTIEIINSGQIGAQVVSRHWRIEDADGEQQEVKGLGVVGRQPFLKPGDSFEYTSGTRMRTPTGSMYGTYFCVAEDGEQFEAVIPRFELDAHNPNAGLYKP